MKMPELTGAIQRIKTGQCDSVSETTVNWMVREGRNEEVLN